jgi:outer membrane receptor protein involved in Fe transport
MRGTPTSLYGNDAVGGVVQLVTRAPAFDSSETQVRGEAYAAFDTAELARTLRATVDVGNNALASSFSAEYMQTGDRRIGGGERIGPSGYDSKAARWVLSVTPTDNRSWLFDLQYLEQPSTPRIDELVAGFGQTEPSSSEYFFAPNRRAFAHGKYTVKAGPGGLDWTTDIAWQRVDDDRISRNYEATDRRRESNSSDLFGLTFSASQLNDSGSWIVGAELYDDKVRSRRTEEDLLTGATEVRASRFPDGSRVRQAAMFGNVQRQLNDRHNLSAGIRVTNDDVTLPQTLVSAAADINNTDLSGDLGWIFGLSDGWQLVANVGLGFRAPNVFDLGTFGSRPGNRFNIPNTTLESERVTQVDIGVRYRSNRAHLNLMAYSLRYKDRITSVDTGAITPEGRSVVQSLNAGESAIRGVEASLDYWLSDFLRAYAVLNYTWGEQQVFGRDAEPAGRMPPLNGRVSLSYDAASRYVLEGWVRFATDQERLSARDISDVRIDLEGTPGWVVIGARWHKEYADSWRVSVALDNLFDNQYRNHGSGLDAPGRNIMVSARFSW